MMLKLSVFLSLLATVAGYIYEMNGELYDLNPPYGATDDRPFTVIPQPCPTRYFLLTRNNPDNPEELFTSNQQVRDSTYFDPELETYFIIHGLYHSSRLYWVKLLSEAILEEKPVNIILVDWSSCSWDLYVRQVQNLRVVGRNLAGFISNLEIHGYDVGKIVLVGLNFGCHIAGYAGKILKGILKQIHALDPTGVQFQGDPQVHLSREDAAFVMVFYTDLTNPGFGMREPIGHWNIYVNGGEKMPACPKHNYTDEEGWCIFNPVIGPLGCPEYPTPARCTELMGHKKFTREDILSLDFLIYCNHYQAANHYIHSAKHSENYLGLPCANVEACNKMLGKLVLVLTIVAITRGEEVCYGSLGCFSNGSPYSYTLERPYSPVPWPPEEVGTRFLLFTQQNKGHLEVVTPKNISSSAFSSQKKSCFIIHGFLDSGYEDWVLAMCRALLEVSDINCFSVDWKAGAHALYPQSASNIRVVGAVLAQFIDFLMEEMEYPLSEIHLIGHSLGAHVAGEAGKRRPGIARISGMDPAGPYFEYTPPEVRLDSTDAIFVDAIHTDGSCIILHLGLGGFGMLQAIGHLDFYPNGGEYQPGCSKIHLPRDSFEGLFEGVENKVLCNHQRSHQMFLKSILQPNGFVAYPAASYSDFQTGAGFPCSNGSCPVMGYYADLYTWDPTTSQTFYLDTGAAKDFPRWRYNVSVTVTGSSFLMGSFSISFCGNDKCSSPHQIHNGFITSDSTYTAFVDAAMDVDPVERVVFVWQKMILYFLSPTLGASSVSVQDGPEGEWFSFCGVGEAEENGDQTLDLCSPSA